MHIVLNELGLREFPLPGQLSSRLMHISITGTFCNFLWSESLLFDCTYCIYVIRRKLQNVVYMKKKSMLKKKGGCLFSCQVFKCDWNLIILFVFVQMNNNSLQIRMMCQSSGHKKSMLKKKGEGQHLKKGEQHRVLSTSTCDFYYL
jgi:hypothetical protein